MGKISINTSSTQAKSAAAYKDAKRLQTSLVLLSNGFNKNNMHFDSSDNEAISKAISEINRIINKYI